ncbi:uncharacterized protein PODANS_4_3635 [Podospora anserina S mat+]|uniref:Podospora anserina S mat+ genomic DNA chromosome 4, supercontig 4 n=1 Tax=Podospora anserina (strain S / ATCC MYA-4624 / DSM 980 / FGSC 10383) TaxID=515849 RepID=B2AQN5_PODAN|nr:uncharacterized protein PODANS_4_3635 [Podospora anserina S mat+]CAP66462.1 unnamed protein product [Podospora anserina S mat+]CDP28190.1 Putative protein of unknown function [Podospora anserina S mat+]
MHHQTLLPILALALGAAAKTDIGGCVSTKVPYMTQDTLVYSSLLWYLPDTGEICEILDCGGGRAPPKTNVPGCGNYAGTEEYKPRFWTGFNAEPTTTSVVAKPTTEVKTATTGVEATTTKKSEVPVETGAVGNEEEETEAPKPTTLVTVSTSADGSAVTRTVEEVVESTEGAGAEGAQDGGDAEGERSSSSGSSTSVSTAGAAPTGVVMMGIVAGVAAGMAFVA